jgi:FkbM family methyltransferase
MRTVMTTIADAMSALAWRADRTRRWSFAQEGEDLVLLRFLEGRSSGFYVDVGAHDPRRFSNTFRFYELDWRGINIDANPRAIEAFVRTRPRDINLALGVAEQPGRMTYYEFDEPALNTFDEALKVEREAHTRYRVVNTASVAVERLDSILARHLPPGQAIDFLSVDVEGYDLQVLRSNDWTRHRPGFVLVEALDFVLERAAQHPIHVFMGGAGYELVAKTLNTLFYRAKA